MAAIPYHTASDNIEYAQNSEALGCPDAKNVQHPFSVEIQLVFQFCKVPNSLPFLPPGH